MEFTLDESGKSGTITIADELTIERADELRKILIKAMEQTDSVTLDIRNVTNFDLSALQLFCSAHRTFAKKKKNVSFGEYKSEIIKEIIKESGFERHKGCHEPYDSCLWLGGKK